MDQINVVAQSREPWNKGKLVGQKAPLKLKEIWAIRIRLQLSHRVRDLALFDLAIDSKLRACDLVKLRVRDVSHGDRIAARAIIMQQKTHVNARLISPARLAVIRGVWKASSRTAPPGGQVWDGDGMRAGGSEQSELLLLRCLCPEVAEVAA